MSSILSTVPLYLLANPMALNLLLDAAGQGLDWKLWAYAAFTQRDGSRPDHVFRNRWDKFEAIGAYRSQKPEPELDLLETIRLVAEGYLEISNGRLYVRNRSDEAEDEVAAQSSEAMLKYGKSAHYDRWQNIRARMTTWPLKLYMLHRRHSPADFFLAHPPEPMVADFIRTEGLNETHLHLNGCLYPEEEWLHDLYDIPKFLQWEENDYRNKESIREHYANVNPRLTPLLAANRLKLAASLRDVILLLELKSGADALPVIAQALLTIRRYALLPQFFSAPPRAAEVPRDLQKRKQQEMMMWMRAFRMLEQGSDFPYKKQLQIFLHLYLLLENEHIYLNCHTERRKGFAAFDVANDHSKLAVGNAAYYEHTFYNLLKSAEAGGQNYVEVRVAPKGLRRHKDLYVRSYERACLRWEKERKEQLRMQRELPPQSFRRPQLVLVTHLIKSAPKPPPSRNSLLLPPLYESERKQHMEEAALLAQDAHYLMAQHRVPVAIDAANSELNQAPEVFAPAYRLFENESGVSHKTYHCGEDFLHLISGIRAVYEAVTFLDLRNGNRIGHGIAIGIPPKVWAESMPGKLILSQRDWLLDTVFVWTLMHGVNAAVAEKAEREALRMAGLIFASDSTLPLPAEFQYNSIHTLSNFFDMRQFEPTYVRRWLDGGLPLSSYQAAEQKKLEEKKELYGTIPAELFWQWNINPECRRAQEKLIEVKRDFLTPAELLELQQRMQHLIAVRDVVIETLPVSNLRIGQIRHIQEHHILRWLKVGGYAEKGDADMNICMGSDDPGIFATDIKNEYYHLYMCLRNAGVPAHEAVEKLRRVNAAGRIYAFSKLPDMKPTPFRILSLLNNTPRPLTFRERFERYMEHHEQEGGAPYDRDRPFGTLPRRD